MSDSAVPPLSYPVFYTFRVVAKQEPAIAETIRQVVEALAGALPDESVSERPSRGGNYVAVHVSCLLTSEEQRREIYFKLKASPGVVLSL